MWWAHLPAMLKGYFDRVNKNRTMFNGGTGLLAKGRITKVLLTSGWIVSTILALFASVEMVLIFQYHWLLLLGLSAALFLGLEYSLPPFRLSKLGLGELAAFIAYGVPLMVVGLAASILPFLTDVVIVANLDAYEIPAGMKMINIMGMSVTNAVACAIIPAIYYLVQI